MDIYLLSIGFLILLFSAIAFRFKLPYTNEKNTHRNKKSDYSILLASLLIILFCIYVELQYNIMGSKIGYEVLTVSILFLLAAFYFDHIALLSISLTGIATSIELIINPSDMLNPLSFDKSETIFSLLFGVSLVLAGKFLEKNNIKKHFTYTNFNFAANLLFLYSLLGLTLSEDKIIYFFVLFLCAFYFVKYSIQEKSKYFLVISILYPYAGSAYLLFKYLFSFNSRNLIYFSMASILVFLIIFYNIRKGFFQKL